MQTMTAIERRRLAEIAREYRKLGYEVIVEPKSSQLPAFLTPFNPDMLAKNSNEIVVVEVKSRDTLSQSPDMEQLAAVIQQQKGWRFELVVTNSRDKGTRIRIHDTNDLLATQDIIYRLNEARALSDKEHGEAAFLLAWSATEAALRRIAVQNALSGEQPSSPMIKSLFSQGLLSEDQYKHLNQGMAARDSLIYGLNYTKVGIAELTSLLTITEQILSEQ